MPAWLISFLAAVLEPVIKQVLAQLGYAIDMKHIQAQSDATNAALDESQKANTADERKKAIHDIASASND